MTRALLLAAALLGTGLFTPPEVAHANAGPIAQVICASSDTMRARLERQYLAERVWSGLRGPDEILELWEEPSGDWSLTIVYAEGKRCIVAMGSALTPFRIAPHG